MTTTGVNEQFGLKTNQSSKLIKDAENRAKAAQIELDFYSTPFPFTSVDPKSANHLFGNGQWKKMCINQFGQEAFDKYSEKYVEGNSKRAIDFKITAFHTPQASYFQQNEKIEIVDKNGTYTGTGKVLSVEDKCYVVVMMPFTCSSTGTIRNITRRDGAQKAFNRFNQLIADMSPSPTVETKKEVIKEVVVEAKPEATIINPVFEKPVEIKEEIACIENKIKTNNKKQFACAMVILLAIAVLIAIYKNKPKTNS